MILVLLGTQDKPFTRLLDTIQKQIDNSNIKEKVIVQAGCTKYSSKDMEIFDLIPNDDILALEKKASLIITHGGVGTIFECLKMGKKVIVAPRLKKYGEHVNDHQLQITNAFSEKGYLLPLKDFNQLDKLLHKAKTFKPTAFISNTDKFVELIENYIDQI